MKTEKKICVVSLAFLFLVCIRVLCSQQQFYGQGMHKKSDGKSFVDWKNGYFSDYDERGNLCVESMRDKVIFYDYDEENHLRFAHVINIENGTQEFIDFTENRSD